MSEQSLDQSPVKRRRYTASFKRRIVEACLAKEASVPQIALAHGLNANMDSQDASSFPACHRECVCRIADGRPYIGLTGTAPSARGWGSDPC